MKPDKVDRSKYMTRKEAAAYLGIPFERVGPLVDRGTLTGMRRGHWQYVTRTSAEDFKRRTQR